ncbi:hypothetical protein CEK25_009151 [Fusarium fujikuroi]|nr:hypothetical protein CEK25_009151 [Fusarium fujikuroi]
MVRQFTYNASMMSTNGAEALVSPSMLVLRFRPQHSSCLATTVLSSSISENLPTMLHSCRLWRMGQEHEVHWDVFGEWGPNTRLVSKYCTCRYPCMAGEKFDEIRGISISLQLKAISWPRLQTDTQDFARLNLSSPMLLEKAISTQAVALSHQNRHIHKFLETSIATPLEIPELDSRCHAGFAQPWTPEPGYIAVDMIAGRSCALNNGVMLDSGELDRTDEIAVWTGNDLAHGFEQVLNIEI